MMPAISVETLSTVKSSLKSIVKNDSIPQNVFKTDNLILKSCETHTEDKNLQIASRNLGNNHFNSSRLDNQIFNTEDDNLDLDISEILEIE